MKNKLLKKITVFGMVSLLLFVPTVSKAEKVCTIHKNYYLYGLISEAPNLVYNVYETDPTTYYHAAYFPMLPEDAEPTEGQRDILKGRVCLQKGDKIDGNASLNQCNFGIWTVEEFYQKRYSMAQDSTNFKNEEFVDKNGKTRTINIYIENNVNEDGNPEEIRYYSGADWFRCGNSECHEEGNESKRGVNTDDADISKLVAATYLPSETIIEFNPAVSNLTTAKRTISVGKTNKDDSNFSDYLEYDDTKVKVGSDGKPIINPNSQIVKPINIVWKQGENAKDSLLAPAVYYVEYQTCEDLYKATINYYYYYKDGGTTKELVDFGKNVKNPYTETGFLPGDTKDVASPEKKGCTIVDTKGNKNDADKIVTIAIDKTNPEDFTKDVYYHCNVLDSGKQEPTGDFLIYFAWIIGIGAIGYSIYYFRKIKKEEV